METAVTTIRIHIVCPPRAGSGNLHRAIDGVSA
jgi:hypothetical protein